MDRECFCDLNISSKYTWSNVLGCFKNTSDWFYGQVDGSKTSFDNGSGKKNGLHIGCFKEHIQSMLKFLINHHLGGLQR